MSENRLSVIATDPIWRPTPSAAASARALLQRVAAAAEAVELLQYEQVTFIDQGANLEEIRCPACGATIELAWWQDAMDKASMSAFRNLAVTAPCCRRSTTLNDLDYRWPAGFASFELRALTPGRSWLSEDELTEMARVLGHDVRQVMAHV